MSEFYNAAAPRFNLINGEWVRETKAPENCAPNPDYSPKKYRGDWNFMNPHTFTDAGESGYYCAKFPMEPRKGEKTRGGGAKKRRGSAWKGLGKREPNWSPWENCYILKDQHPGIAVMIKRMVKYTLGLETSEGLR